MEAVAFYLTGAFGLVRDLNSDLETALDSNLADVVDRVDDVRALARALFRAREAGRDLVRVLGPAIIIACDHTHVLDRDRDLATTLALSRDFDRLLTHAIDLARALNLDFDLARDFNLDLNRTRALANNLGVAHDLVSRSALDRSLTDRDDFVGGAAGAPEVRSSQAAVRVIYRVVRMLPLSARDRYSEEFERELLDLATDGVSRRGQLAHAIRVAGRTWSLRRAALHGSLAKDTG